MHSPLCMQVTLFGLLSGLLWLGNIGMEAQLDGQNNDCTVVSGMGQARAEGLLGARGGA